MHSYKDEKRFDQRIILQLMDDLGYHKTHKPEEDGVCEGISHMVMQSAVTGHLSTAIARLNLIRDTPDIKNKILAAQKKLSQERSTNIKLTKDELKYLDVIPFLDGINIFQTQYKHGEFLEKPIYLSATHFDIAYIPYIESVSSFTASKEMEEKKDSLVVVDAFLKKSQPLTAYVDHLNKIGIDFREQIKKDKTPNQCVGVVMRNPGEHAILLLYVDDKTYLLDPNNMPLVELKPEEIKEKIQEALLYKNTQKSAVKDAPVPFSAAVFVSRNNLLQSLSLKNFIGQHASDKMFSRAIETNDLELMQAIGEKKSQQYLNNRDYMLSRTPLLNAIELNHKDIAGFLLDCGADVNARDILGKTPAHLAAAKNSIELIRRLAKLHCDFDVKDTNGNTPHMDLTGENWNIAAVIFMNKSQLSPEDLYCIAPLERERITLLVIACIAEIKEMKTDDEKTHALQQLAKKENAMGKLLEQVEKEEKLFPPQLGVASQRYKLFSHTNTPQTHWIDTINQEFSELLAKTHKLQVGRSPPS